MWFVCEAREHKSLKTVSYNIHSSNHTIADDTSSGCATTKCILLCCASCASFHPPLPRREGWGLSRSNDFGLFVARETQLSLGPLMEDFILERWKFVRWLKDGALCVQRDNEVKKEKRSMVIVTILPYLFIFLFFLV